MRPSAGMDPFGLFLSGRGRLAPGPFAIAVTLVYLAGFASQALLSGPVIARSGLLPFALVQAVLTWGWYVLHVKRLTDAGRSSGGALASAVLYALAVALLLLVVSFFIQAGAPDASGDKVDPSSIFGLFMVLYVIGMMFSSLDFGFFTMLITAAVVVALAPVVVVFVFSIYVGTRPSAPPASSPALPPS